jgi:hypothetical protein
MRFILFVCLLCFSAFQQAEDVFFPGAGGDDYPSVLLQHVLSYSADKNYQLRFYNKGLPKNRALKLIENNNGIDVIAAGTNKSREHLLLPVRFPILKGLNGWRVALVAKNNDSLFLAHSNLNSFKTLTAGQLHSWSDTKVIESNGIEVVKASNYQGLFEMLENKRFDYFPRSILEVAWEYEANKQRDIIIEPYRLIHYPTAYYYFVNKNNTQLAKTISFGLEQALKDGSFTKLFNKYFSRALIDIRDDKRKVIELTNALLPVKTPLERTELWLDLH